MKKYLFLLVLALVGCGSFRKNTQAKEEQLKQVEAKQIKETVESSKEAETVSTSSTSEIELLYEAKKDSVGNYVPLIYTEVQGRKTLREIAILGPGVVRVRNLQQTNAKNEKTSDLKTTDHRSKSVYISEKKAIEKQVIKKSFPWYLLWIVLGFFVALWLKKRVTIFKERYSQFYQK